MQQDYNNQLSYAPNQTGFYPYDPNQQSFQPGMQGGAGYQYLYAVPQPPQQGGLEYQYNPIVNNSPIGSNRLTQVSPSDTQSTIDPKTKLNNKINSSFRFYLGLLGFELIKSFVYLSFTFRLVLKHEQYILSLIYISILVAGCLLAILSKYANMPTLLGISFPLFFASKILGIITSILIAIFYFQISNEICPESDSNCEGWWVGKVITLVFAVGALVNIIAEIIEGIMLLYLGRNLLKLMRERKALPDQPYQRVQQP